MISAVLRVCVSAHLAPHATMLLRWGLRSLAACNACNVTREAIQKRFLGTA